MAKARGFTAVLDKQYKKGSCKSNYLFVCIIHFHLIFECFRAQCEPPMTKVTGFPFFRNGTTFLTIRVISQLEGMTPLSHRNIPKIRKVLNTLT